MYIFKYFSLTLIFLSMSIAISFPSLAGDSCRINAVEDPVLSTPPLCRGKSINALLSATTSQPNFSNVTDILQGERNLLQVDDLVIKNPTSKLAANVDGGSNTFLDFIVFTEDKAITEVIGPDIIATSNNCDTNNGGTGNTTFPYGSPSAQQTNAVRMFNLDRDLIVTYSLKEGSNCINNATSITTQDPLGIVSIPVRDNVGTKRSSYPDFMHSAVGDFNNDGYEDILIIKGGVESGMFVISANDPDVPESGYHLGPFKQFQQDPAKNFTSIRNPMSSPVIGDFNGDTIIDVAWVGSRALFGSPYNVFFASICPGPTENIPLCRNRGEFEIVTFIKESQIIPLDTVVNSLAEFAYPASALAAGDFNPNPDTSAGDDLMVIYGQAGEGGLAVEYYTFDNSLNHTLRDSHGGTAKIYNTYADSGQFDRTQPGDQAVIAVQAPGGPCHLWVYTFDDEGFIRHDSEWVGGNSGNGTCTEAHGLPSQISLNGMTVGRFTSEIPQNATDLDLQIAIFLSDYTLAENRRARFRILQADSSNNFVAKFVSGLSAPDPNLVSYFGNKNPNRGGSFIRPGDLQGRSLLLGAPSVARIPKFTQINLIQGTPPMHGGYVQILGDDGPEVNNFSVIPEGFETVFTSETSSSTTSTNMSTSSWTYSFMEGFDFNAKYKLIPFTPGSSIQFDLSFSAEQLYGCNVSTVNSSYSSDTFGISVVSGFGDEIIFTQQRQNVYYYPVIGSSICPDGTEDCNENEKQPLYIQFSAPDQIYRDRINEINIEFYQPIHEPGNIFTYPWTLNQLLSRFESAPEDLLTPSNPTGWFTDTSATTEFTNWTQGSGNECTTETDETYTFNESLSIGYGNSVLEQERSGANLKFNFDFSQSSSNGTMISDISMTSDSTGVSTIKPDSFIDPPLYQYRVQTYIFGEKFPEGVWDTANPEGSEANIDSTGALKVGFTVNPTVTGAGNWWQSGPGVNPYKAFPDLALNHPNQWRIVGLGVENNQEPPPNCRTNLINENRATCLFKRQPAANASQLWLSGFYGMRGLIVQVGDEAIGPQVATSVVGDDVHLTARIYNNSFKNFDAGTIIKAQFYRQQWDPTNVEPIGNSVLIEEVVTSPVPAFNSESAIPNWKSVSTTFNTTQQGMQGDTWWIFWVLVWAIDSNGDLVDELPGHGFTNSSFNPGDVYNSILDVPLEIVSVEEAGVNIQTSFTNNIGFWPQEFYVAPETINDELFSSAEIGEIVIENIIIEKDNIFVDDEILIEADVWSIGARTHALSVTLNEGHPDDTDEIYDIEVMTHILADDSNKFRVLYQPRLCGERDLYLSAGPEGPSAPTATMASVTLNVQCSPGDRNIDGQLIGPNGQPVSMNSNCSVASANTEIGASAIMGLVVYMLIPGLIIVRRKFDRE